jgi:hypothetical protein
MSRSASGVDPAEIEAIVRTYLARTARRYTPLIGTLVVLVLLATLVPSKSSQQQASTGIASGAQAGSFDGTDISGEGGAASGGSAAAGIGPQAGGRSTVAPPAAGITTPPPAGARGVARSGVNCGPGVRQVTWTPYAPPCIPRYTGNNGGNRYRGVTRDKIIAFYRRARSAQDAAINAALGDANLDDERYMADLRTYMAFFNKQFELYGRQLEMVVFDAQGDYLQEHQGLDQGQAQADAQRAVDLNGFVDVTFPLKGSYPFWQALAERKAITLGPTGFPQRWYEERSPYWFSSLPTGTGVASWLSNMVCARMAGMNASFAGSPVYQRTKRVFGLVHPDNPEYKEIGDLVQREISRCGAAPARRISYTINVATMGNQSTSIIAQLKAANVTTVLCYCDPVVPIFLTNSADGQDYHPEWWSPGWGDAQAQQLSQNQWTHAIVIGGEYPARKDDQAYRVYKLANPNGEPQSPYYAVAYGILLLLYDALQQAGPDLNPVNFQKGWFSLGTISGPAGTLVWKPGNFSPVISAPASWYDPNKTSNFDGDPGSYRECQGGSFFPFDLARRREWGSGQMSCFGK